MSRLAASFRDPDGFLFTQKDKVLRCVNHSYKADYEKLMQSGLYESLVNKSWLIEHREIEVAGYESCYRVLQPEQLDYISYPYEWSFSQLRDAALLTLDIQVEALNHGMSLKDGSAYNIQFHRGKPVFIDTLSFEIYEEGKPWVAYRQFCQHFLAPLALVVYRDYRLVQLLKSCIDGIPLDLASRLLPLLTWCRYSMLVHLHIHAMAQRRYENTGKSGTADVIVDMSITRLRGLLQSLRGAVASLRWKYSTSEWGSYYTDTNYDETAMSHKASLVKDFLAEIKTGERPLAADFGANTGVFSRLAAAQGYFVLAHDIDEVAVDKNYREMQQNGEHSILPLVQNLVNPSPAIGWDNNERMSFMQRQDVEVGLVLALIHHICISNNVPLGYFAEFLAKICRSLIIEFVPKTDSQVIRLLATREDIFPDYNEKGFEEAFSVYFSIINTKKISSSERIMYLMKRKQA